MAMSCSRMFQQVIWIYFCAITGAHLGMRFNRKVLDENLFFDTYVLREQIVHSETECAFHCKTQNQCLSYNFEHLNEGGHRAVKCLLKREVLDRYSGTAEGNYATGQKANAVGGKIYPEGASSDQCPYTAPFDQVLVCPDFPTGGTREQCHVILPNCCWDEDITVTGDLKCYLNGAVINSDTITKWTEVYAHKFDGSPIWGNLNSIIEHVRAGAHLRILADPEEAEKEGKQLSVPMETVYAMESGQVCLVTPPDLVKLDLLHIVKGTEEYAREWIVRKVCTTGEVEILTVGLGTNDLQSISFKRMSVRWFAKALTRSTTASSTTSTATAANMPVYSVLSGSRTIGSINALVEAHARGLPFFPVTSESSGKVVGRNVRVNYYFADDPVGTVRTFTWSVAMDTGLETPTFVYPDPYFNIEAFLVNGNLVSTNWLISKQQRVKANTVSQKAVNWLVDDRWEIMFQHDSNGTPMEGNLNNLVKAIRGGRKIRIVATVNGQVMGFLLEMWIIVNDPLTVWAQVTSRSLASQEGMSRHSEQVFADAEDPLSELWLWFATSGYCGASYIPYAERTTSFRDSSFSAEQTWLAEKAHSRLVYSVDAAGVTSGSVGELIEGLSTGGELVLARNHGSFIYCLPHSYEFNSTAVAVTLTSEYSMGYDGRYYFKQNLYQTILLYTTNGPYQMLRWYHGGAYISTKSSTLATYWYITI